MRRRKDRFFMIRTKSRRNSLLGFDLAAARRDASGSIIINAGINTSIGINVNDIINIDININANIHILY